jgi:preprotein translocase subunit SecG
VIYVLIPLYIIVCLFLIGVVLLQQGKGADLAGAFGVGSGSQAAFGARSATTLLHKLTAGAFVAFIVFSLALSILQSRGGKSSVVAGVQPKAPAPATALPAAPVKTPPALPATN